MLNLHRDKKIVRREPGRDDKILGAHRQDGNVEAHRLEVRRRGPLINILLRPRQEKKERTTKIILASVVGNKERIRGEEMEMQLICTIVYLVSSNPQYHVSC